MCHFAECCCAECRGASGVTYYIKSFKCLALSRHMHICCNNNVTIVTYVLKMLKIYKHDHLYCRRHGTELECRYPDCRSAQLMHLLESTLTTISVLMLIIVFLSVVAPLINSALSTCGKLTPSRCKN